MARREKIILFLMIMAIVYGIYSIFFTSPSRTSFGAIDKGSENAVQVVIDAAQNIAREDFSETHAHIIARASAEWTREPFLKSATPLKSRMLIERTEALTDNADFIYSGYLEIVDKRLAIIDGIEYEEGEILNRTEYIVRNISPAGVVIGPVGEEKNIFLPLKETDTPPLNKTDKQK